MSCFDSLIRFNKEINVLSSATVVGEREIEGPLSEYFDITMSDDRFGEETFEKSETQMVKMAIECALKKSRIQYSDLNLVIGGDLQNQCVAHSFAMADKKIQYFGVYGACSTMAQGLLASGILLDSGHFNTILCSSSSHFSTSERQFRFPLEYGLQRTPTSQMTVTGAASFILSTSYTSGVFVRGCVIGRIVDKGIKDANNMGAAMSGAALDTLQRYFAQSELGEKDFDLILTGDLGEEGANIVREKAHLYGLELGENYMDCGELIYDRQKQNVCSGGSGCGCSAVVLGGYIMDRLQKREIKKVLFVGTGALLSSGSVLQKLSIPAIAHAVEIERK